MKWIIFISILTVTGCSTSKVYLNQRFISDKEVKVIQSDLEGNGYSVQLINVDFPASITRSSLIHSPLLTDVNSLEHIKVILEHQGFKQLNIINLTEGNHWYKHNNMGIYLMSLDPEYLEKAAQQLPSEFSSKNCRTNYQLVLNDNHRFTLYIENQLIKEGSWEITGWPYVRLYNQDPFFDYFYQVSQKHIQEQLGTVKVTDLTPVNSAITVKDCRLVHGVRL